MNMDISGGSQTGNCERGREESPGPPSPRWRQLECRDEAASAGAGHGKEFAAS